VLSTWFIINSRTGEGTRFYNNFFLNKMNSRRTVLILVFILFLTEIKNENANFEEDKILTSERLPNTVTGSDHEFTSKGPVNLADKKAEIDADKLKCKLKDSENIERTDPNENVNLPILFEPVETKSAVIIKILKEIDGEAEMVKNSIAEPEEVDNETDYDDDDYDDDDDDSLNDDLEQLRSILRLLQQILLFLAAGTFSFILLYTAFYINVLRKIYIKPSSCIKK